MRKANRKRRFRPVRLAAIAALSILLLPTLLLVLVRLGTFDRLLVAEASRRLEAASGLILEAEKIDIDPFRLSLRLEKPALHAVEGEGPVLRRFTAESVVLDIPFSVVFGGGLRFEKVRIVRPEAVLTPPPPSLGTPPAPPQAPSIAKGPAASVEPAVFDLRIDDFELENGQAFWRGSPGPLSASLEGLDIRVGYEAVARSHRVSLVTAGGHLQYRGEDLRIERLDIKGRVGRDEIEIETFEVATRGSSIRVEGTVKDYAAVPEFEGRARLSLSVEEFPVQVPLTDGAEGIVGAEIDVSGKEGGLAYRADLSTAGLRTRDLGAVEIAAGIRGTLDIGPEGQSPSGTVPRDPSSAKMGSTNSPAAGTVHEDRAGTPVRLGTLEVTGLDVRTEAGAITGTVSADLGRKTLTAVDLEWTALDLDRIPALRAVFAGLPVAIGSLVSGRVTGKAGSFTLGGLDGSLELALVPRPERGASPGAGKRPFYPAGEIALRASGGEFFLNKARLRAAGISLEASGSVRRDGRLHGRYAMTVESVPATFEALRLSGLVTLQPGRLVAAAGGPGRLDRHIGIARRPAQRPHVLRGRRRLRAPARRSRGPVPEGRRPGGSFHALRAGSVGDRRGGHDPGFGSRLSESPPAGPVPSSDSDSSSKISSSPISPPSCPSPGETARPACSQVRPRSPPARTVSPPFSPPRPRI